MSSIVVGNILQGQNKFTKPSVVTIGKFSLFHKGHEQILIEIEKERQSFGLHPIIFSFYPSPSYFFLKEKPILSIRNRYKSLLHFFKETDFTYFLQKFNLSFSALDAERFLSLLINKFNVKSIVVGSDFAFGKNKGGDINFLINNAAKLGINIKVIEIKQHTDYNISSKNLKNLLTSGKIEQFNQLIYGGLYTISGVVLHGKKLANNELKVKTANIRLNQKLVLPKFGVYICMIYFKGSTFYGIANIGIKPTLNLTESIPLLEVNIFNFNKEIYGKRIEVQLLKFVRNEKKFDSLSELKVQIEDDINVAEKFIKEL